MAVVQPPPPAPLGAGGEAGDWDRLAADCWVVMREFSLLTASVFASCRHRGNRRCSQRREPASRAPRLSDTRQGVRPAPCRWRLVETELSRWQRRTVAPLWP